LTIHGKGEAQDDLKPIEEGHTSSIYAEALELQKILTEEKIEDLVDFMQKNPNKSAEELVNLYLG